MDAFEIASLGDEVVPISEIGPLGLGLLRLADQIREYLHRMQVIPKPAIECIHQESDFLVVDLDLILHFLIPCIQLHDTVLRFIVLGFRIRLQPSEFHFYPFPKPSFSSTQVFVEDRFLQYSNRLHVVGYESCDQGVVAVLGCPGDMRSRDASFHRHELEADCLLGFIEIHASFRHSFSVLHFCENM